MAFTRPPTFTNGQVLGATQLNMLSDDLEYLYGVATAPVMPQPSLVVTGDLDHTAPDNTWFIRHRYRYLHFRFMWITGNDPTDLRIYFDYPTETTAVTTITNFTNLTDTAGSYTIYSSESGTTPSVSIEQPIDLHDTGVISPTPSVGTWYQIRVYCDTGVSDLFIVCYLIESDSTSLYPS